MGVECPVTALKWRPKNTQGKNSGVLTVCTADGKLCQY